MVTQRPETAKNDNATQDDARVSSPISMASQQEFRGISSPGLSPLGIGGERVPARGGLWIAVVLLVLIGVLVWFLL